MVTKEEMKKKLKEFIDSHPGTTFVEIEDHFAHSGFEYKGNRFLSFPEGTPLENGKTAGENIVAWYGWNEEAMDIICDLLNKEDYFLKASNIILYMIDGKCLTLPIAKNISHNYKNIHWLPTVVNRNYS